jgi:hypothetical protein
VMKKSSPSGDHIDRAGDSEQDSNTKHGSTRREFHLDLEVL